jgi:hypothetical protein
LDIAGIEEALHSATTVVKWLLVQWVYLPRYNKSGSTKYLLLVHSAMSEHDFY